MSQELFTNEDVEAILGSVNENRLAPYIKSAEGDEFLGAKLYLWNMQISSSFWFAFHILEVTLRNSIDKEMILISSFNDWLDDTYLLHRKELNKIEVAKEKLIKQNKTVTHDRIIAELNFGFWLSLFQNNYHQALWESGLKDCFPNFDGRRSGIYASLEDLVKLRNRVAHHEPVFSINIEERFAKLISLVSYMNSNLAGLIIRKSDLIGLIDLHPLKKDT